MKKIIIFVFVCLIGLSVAPSLNAQNIVSNSNIEIENNDDYKLLKKVSIQEVEEMKFKQFIEIIPASLKKDLKKVYRKKDNKEKELFLSSLKLMTINHIKETK